MLGERRSERPRRRRAAELAAFAALALGCASAWAGPAPEPPPQVAFVRFDPHSGRLLVLGVSRSGGPPRPLALRTSDAQSPSWSPNGRLLAFVAGTGASEGRSVSGDVDLYVAAADGTHAQQPTRGGRGKAAPPCPPGGTPLFSPRQSRTGNASSLWVV